MCVAEVRLPRIAATLARMQLVVYGWMQIRRDQGVQTFRLLGGEPESATVVPRRSDSQALERTSHTSARLAAQGLVVEHRLALTPPSEGASEASVVSIP